MLQLQSRRIPPIHSQRRYPIALRLALHPSNTGISRWTPRKTTPTNNPASSLKATSET